MTTSLKKKYVIKNKKAYHDYSIKETLEAGIVLHGWEVKSIRNKRVQIIDSYVQIKKGEIWLLNTIITPLSSTCNHFDVEPTGTRKLLVQKREISKLFGIVNKQGYTLVPLSIYWKHNKIKVSIGIVKGKKAYDKRQESKNNAWKREQSRLLKRSNL